jgi:hypothetical protein
MASILAAALLLGSAAPGVQVDVGRANWRTMPPLKAARRDLPTPDMVGRVQDMLASGQCRLEGQTPHRFDVTIPYAVLVQPDGQLQRVVVGESGCTALETYVGEVVLAMAGAGDFKPTGEPGARWFSGAVNFNLQ